MRRGPGASCVGTTITEQFHRARVRKSLRRKVACTALLVATAPYLYCTFAHWCMCGHGAHTWRSFDTGIDIAWWSGLVVAAVLIVRSDAHRRFVILTMACIMFGSNMFLGDPFFGLLAAVPACILALRALLRGPAPAREGVCAECGYNLTGNVSGVCPECGTAVAGAA